MKIKSRPKIIKKAISVALSALMLVGVVPSDTFAVLDFDTTKIDVMPTNAMTLDKPYASNIHYTSPNFGAGGGRIYDIIAQNKTTGYRGAAFCIDKGNSISASNWNEPKLLGSSGYDIDDIYSEIKPYLDIYYYVTHTDAGQQNGKWSNSKKTAFTAALQYIIWLNQLGHFQNLSQAEKQKQYANEMYAAITFMNTNKNPGDADYISNDGIPYTMEQCIDSITFMASATVPSTSKFDYYVMKPSNSGSTNHSQYLIMPYYTFKQINEQPVYIQWDKTSEEGTALSGASFNVIDNETGLVIDTIASTTGHYIAGPYLIPENTSATYTVAEEKAPSGYSKDESAKTVTASTQANGTSATAAWVGGSKANGTFVNKKITHPPTTSPVIKIDAETGERLSGAVFRFTGAGGAYDYTTVNGELNVKLQWENPSDKSTYIPPGTYTVTEIKAPPGYELATESQTITLNKTWNWASGHGPGTEHDLEEGSSCTEGSASCGSYQYTNSGPITFQNYSRNVIELIKTDETGTPLAGAVFSVYKDLAHIGDYTTNNSGRIYFFII